MSFKLAFLLLVGLLQASLYKEVRIKPLEPAPILKELDKICQVVFSKPFKGNYENYDPPHGLPAELWLQILSEAAPFDLWNISIVNKFLGALVRTETSGQVQRMKKMEVLEHIIYTSDLNLPKSLWHPWHEADKLHQVLREHMAEVDRYYYDPTYKVALTRITDPEFVIQLLKDRFKWNETARLIPRSTMDQLYRCDRQSGSSLMWIPNDNGPKLFQIMSPNHCLMTVMHLIVHNCGNFSTRSFIVPALISQYILPAYKGDIILSQEEIDSIKVVAPFLSKPMSEYFIHLHWALFYQTNTVNITNKTIGRIARLMQSLGFKWKDTAYPRLTTPLCNKRKAGLSVNQQETILRVAKQWDLDLDKIVENSSSFSVPSMKLCGNYTEKLMPIFLDVKCDAYTVGQQMEMFGALKKVYLTEDMKNVTDLKPKPRIVELDCEDKADVVEEKNEFNPIESEFEWHQRLEYFDFLGAPEGPESDNDADMLICGSKRSYEDAFDIGDFDLEDYFPYEEAVPQKVQRTETKARARTEVDLTEEKEEKEEKDETEKKENVVSEPNSADPQDDANPANTTRSPQFPYYQYPPNNTRTQPQNNMFFPTAQPFVAQNNFGFPLNAPSDLRHNHTAQQAVFQQNNTGLPMAHPGNFPGMPQTHAYSVFQPQNFMAPPAIFQQNNTGFQPGHFQGMPQAHAQPLHPFFFLPNTQNPINLVQQQDQQVPRNNSQLL